MYCVVSENSGSIVGGRLAFAVCRQKKCAISPWLSSKHQHGSISTDKLPFVAVGFIHYQGGRTDFHFMFVLQRFSNYGLPCNAEHLSTSPKSFLRYGFMIVFVYVIMCPYYTINATIKQPLTH
jgi:hypothetical protein